MCKSGAWVVAECWGRGCRIDSIVRLECRYGVEFGAVSELAVSELLVRGILEGIGENLVGGVVEIIG